MTIVIHFVNQRRVSKSYTSVYSIIHKPEHYLINYAIFPIPKDRESPELVTFKIAQKDVKWMTIH